MVLRRVEGVFDADGVTSMRSSEERRRSSQTELWRWCSSRWNQAWDSLFLEDQVVRRSSPCHNGGTCVNASGSAASPSCLCPSGFSGDFCDIGVDSCQPNPCLNGGNCTNHGLVFTCACPHGFTGFTCNDTTSLSPCAGRPCANEGACVGQPDGTFRCTCQKWFTGPTCSLHHRPKTRSKPAAAKPVDHRVFALTPQHYSLPAHAFHKLLRPPERDLLKITLKET
ncbi:protein delta homolog 1, partial [Austrofundulus limnaeus]|uniref:Protein delta homolog 1 n=1 Tax=Austrofundulus limnaeus TaxID=52670 RepID=A0A2I4ALI0_AUSLI